MPDRRRPLPCATMPRYASGASRDRAAKLGRNAGNHELDRVAEATAESADPPVDRGDIALVGGARDHVVLPEVAAGERSGSGGDGAQTIGQPRPAGFGQPARLARRKTSRNAPGMTQDLPDRPAAPGACVSDRENRETRKRAVRPSCFDRARESLRPPGRRAAMSLAPSRVARSAVVPPRGRSAPYPPVGPGVPLGCRIPLLSRKGGLRCASAGRSTRAVDRRGFAKTGNGPDRIRGRLQRRRIVATWPARR